MYKGSGFHHFQAVFILKKLNLNTNIELLNIWSIDGDIINVLALALFPETDRSQVGTKVRRCDFFHQGYF